MQDLILRSDVEKMLQSRLDKELKSYDKVAYPILQELLRSLSQLESKYEAVAYTPEYILANRIWTPIDTPPPDIGIYLVCDIYLPKAVPAISIGYYNRMGWDRKSYTHWMALPTLTTII